MTNDESFNEACELYSAAKRKTAGTREGVVDGLTRAVTTACNDDRSIDGSFERARQIERVSAMLDAIEYLETVII